MGLVSEGRSNGAATHAILLMRPGIAPERPLNIIFNAFSAARRDDIITPNLLASFLRSGDSLIRGVSTAPKYTDDTFTPVLRHSVRNALVNILVKDFVEAYVVRKGNGNHAAKEETFRIYPLPRASIPGRKKLQSIAVAWQWTIMMLLTFSGGIFLKCIA